MPTIIPTVRVEGYGEPVAAYAVFLLVSADGANVADRVALGSGQTRRIAIDRAKLFVERLAIAVNGLQEGQS